MTLMVLDYNGTEYVSAQPLTRLAGINWRTARRHLETDENRTLYGIKWLPEPLISLQDVQEPLGKEASGGLKASENDLLCIELHKARMYLARINTAQMRVNGDTEGADKLLVLQQE